MGIKQTQCSIKEYLAHEADTSTKHEFERGEILAMTGGSINHGILCGNAYNEIRKHIEQSGKECSTFGSEIRIHIDAMDSIVYPDAMVICEEMATSDKDPDAVINPILVVEVLSKSTESYDRGDKFYKYRQLPSIQEYVLISQDKPVVETFFRKETHIWEIARFVGLEKMIYLKSLAIHFPMANLYHSVNLTNQNLLT